MEEGTAVDSAAYYKLLSTVLKLIIGTKCWNFLQIRFASNTVMLALSVLMQQLT
jgi:hypothetical protein